MSVAELDNIHGEYADLLSQHSERLDRYKQYRQEANKARDPDAQFYLGDTTDYGRLSRTKHEQRYRHHIQLPLGKALTVKHSFRIAGRLPDIVVDKRAESPQEIHRSDIMEKMAWAIIRASGGETLFADGAWNGSEVGTTVFCGYFSIDKQMPCIHSVDPEGFLAVPGVTDPHSFRRTYKMKDSPIRSVQLDYPDAEWNAISPHHNAGGIDMVRVVTYCDEAKQIVFASGLNNAIQLSRYDHGYGFVPDVAIPNIGPYSDIYGWADYEFVRSLVEYLPIMLSREADVLRAVANGAYQEAGTGQNAAQIIQVLNEGGVIPTKRDSTIAPIPAPEMPSFAEAHSDRTFDLFKMLGFAPDASWGGSDANSGSDRGLMLQPLLEYTAMKQMNWQKGLTRLFEYCYQIAEQKQATKASYSGTKPNATGRNASPFSFILGPNEDDQSVPNPDPMAQDLISLPMKPKDIFDGDYCARFVWQNRIDPDDPAYVMSELNKFQASVQSLQTTLERLGFQAPEEEMKRIEREAEKFPWVNQGLVKMLIAQASGGQGQGGGPPVDEAQAGLDASQTMAGPGGQALAADAGAGALGPDSFGTMYGAA